VEDLEVPAAAAEDKELAAAAAEELAAAVLSVMEPVVTLPDVLVLVTRTVPLVAVPLPAYWERK